MSYEYKYLEDDRLHSLLERLSIKPLSCPVCKKHHTIYLREDQHMKELSILKLFTEKKDLFDLLSMIMGFNVGIVVWIIL